MPYAAGVYTLPPGTAATTLTPVDSSDYNAFIADIEAAQNAARPVVAGGTGGNSVITGWDGLTVKGTDVASAGTINLTTATGPRIDITGTTAITAVTLANGSMRIARATGAFQLTASATLVVNKSTSVNYTTVAGDLMIFTAEGGVTSVTVIGSSSSSGAPSAPQGRLTNSTGVPVLTADVTAATTMYYTPYLGRYVPLYNGTSWTMTDTGGELSQTLADTTKSPAATVAEAVYDDFVWSDSGTMRATRGPAWSNTATVTISNASPGVITDTAHGLREGAPVVFTTTGGLPTGLTAGTIYYAHVTGVNTYNVSTSIANLFAGTYVNTSSAGSGTHTRTNRDTSRGSGAGTTELELFQGFYVNKNDITNGPLARRGLYVGSFKTNASNQVDVKFGSLAANGGEAWIGIWNRYNRVNFSATVRDSTDSWTYTVNAWRAANNSPTIRCSFLNGLGEDDYQSVYNGVASGTGTIELGVGLDGVNFTGLTGGYSNAANFIPLTSHRRDAGLSGFHYVQNMEYVTSGTTTFYGDGGTPAFIQTGLLVSGRY